MLSTVVTVFLSRLVAYWIRLSQFMTIIFVRLNITQQIVCDSIKYNREARRL